VSSARVGTDDRLRRAAPAAARLFLALWPDEGERAALAAWCARTQWPPTCSPVRSERLHLTLHFIGALERSRLSELSEALEVAFSPFRVGFSGAELWPRGLLVLPARELPIELARLHSLLADALRRLGLPVEKQRFRPHVTLARHAPAAIAAKQPAPADWLINDYVLVESLLGGAGGYQIVRRYAARLARAEQG